MLSRMFKKRFSPLGCLFPTDGNSAFLRAARAGNLEKVLEFLKGSIDINTSNANGLNALHLASKEGHVNVVTELLKRGANVDAATKKGNTALHIASLAGQEEIVKILVQHGASVNVQSQNGFTPLYMAAQENHDNVVKFLLSNGANQSLATEDGFTPLAVALQQGHDKVVAVLLENDTRGKVRLPALHIAAKKDDCKAAALLLQSDHNPDVTSKSGFTPLHIAAHYGNENIANLLLQRGADVNYAAKHNITPLHVASKWGKTNMLTLLLDKGGNIEAKTRDGLTPLHCAARSGHDQVVDLLLERGAPIVAKTKNGLAPLHMAAQGDHVDSARILLYHKAPVDDVTVDYLTALHVAAHCGHVRVAKLLLDRKADPNARALNGFTPLHIACKKNRIKVVELLLKHGASIEATTESGLTPLHVASFMGCMNIVIYLIQHGSNPDVPTVRGETPLHLAARANQTDIIRILLRNGAHVDARAREQQTPLHIAARLGNSDIVALLLQHGASVDATTKDMYTALHIAAKEGQEEVASVLLEHGASLTATTKKGFTPLHLAAKYGNMKVARLLLQRDAPVDAQGKNGVTPLHVAAHYDNQNVALLLLDKGASPHATAKNGYTPLHIAAKKNQMDIATTLLEYGAKANAESKAGFTPLHLASQEGHTDMSTLLIEHHADVNAKAKNGLTPLHLCAQEDKVNVAAILVKSGAEIDSKTKAGYTPLHVACHFGQINMVRFLLQHGADVNSTTAVGYTPLHQAAQQGHTQIVNLLLEHRASPNAVTNQGQTALSIAQRLGYISVVETLKIVTETVVTTTVTTVTEEKYRVVAPETMQETFMSDSEDEGGEDTMLGDQSYRYLTVDEMKSLGDDSLPIDPTRDERIEPPIIIKETLLSAPPTAEEDELSPQPVQGYAQFTGNYAPDNIDISSSPVHAGLKLTSFRRFLVSFMVDARGGAMRGCRHSGVRVIIPPRKAPMPMRITCRYLKKEKLAHPPPLMEGEACASRILEMGPTGAKFLGPVIIEVPHFASLRGKEREITILRSDNGETWREHTLEASEEAVQEVLNESFDGEELSALEDLNTNRITRILTTDFPQYFAIITRNRQEVHAIGPEGGMVSSTVVPQVQAVFPEGALTKKIKVGLQAQPIPADLVAKMLGNRVAVSPVVTVEPRRRKFHKPITLTIPVPQAAARGMINQYSGETPTLRLLCSITGGTTRAQWEDVTGSTPLTFVNDCVSFTTTVSARFWLMDCRNISEATKMATELYREAIHVPFMAKFVVFAKRHEPLEAKLRVFCMTDDKEDKTLESQEHFIEVAKSRDVEVLEAKSQYVEFAGNLVPVTKSGEQLLLNFHAFRENRLPFIVRVKDSNQEPIGRIAFMREPKVSRGEPAQTPICNLNITLPDVNKPESSTPEKDVLTLEKKYAYLKEMGLSKPETIHKADLRLSDIAQRLGNDWVVLALQLDMPESDINLIKTEYPDDVNQQAMVMLRLWMQVAGNKATGNTLEKALRKINREDIVNQCIFNVELVTDDVERAVAKVHLDQSGFDTLKEELGPSRDASLRRDISLDASYDEQDIMKEAESAEETSSETGSVTEQKSRPEVTELDKQGNVSGDMSHSDQKDAYSKSNNESKDGSKIEVLPNQKREVKRAPPIEKSRKKPVVPERPKALQSLQKDPLKISESPKIIGEITKDTVSVTNSQITPKLIEVDPLPDKSIFEELPVPTAVEAASTSPEAEVWESLWRTSDQIYENLKDCVPPEIENKVIDLRPVSTDTKPADVSMPDFIDNDIIAGIHQRMIEEGKLGECTIPPTPPQRKKRNAPNITDPNVQDSFATTLTSQTTDDQAEVGSDIRISLPELEIEDGKERKTGEVTKTSSTVSQVSKSGDSIKTITTTETITRTIQGEVKEPAKLAESEAWTSQELDRSTPDVLDKQIAEDMQEPKIKKRVDEKEWTESVDGGIIKHKVKTITRTSEGKIISPRDLDGTDQAATRMTDTEGIPDSKETVKEQESHEEDTDVRVIEETVPFSESKEFFQNLVDGKTKSSKRLPEKISPDKTYTEKKPVTEEPKPDKISPQDVGKGEVIEEVAPFEERVQFFRKSLEESSMSKDIRELKSSIESKSKPERPPPPSLLKSRESQIHARPGVDTITEQSSMTTAKIFPTSLKTTKLTSGKDDKGDTGSPTLPPRKRKQLPLKTTPDEVIGEISPFTPDLETPKDTPEMATKSDEQKMIMVTERVAAAATTLASTLEEAETKLALKKSKQIAPTPPVSTSKLEDILPKPIDKLEDEISSILTMVERDEQQLDEIAPKIVGDVVDKKKWQEVDSEIEEAFREAKTMESELEEEVARDSEAEESGKESGSADASDEGKAIKAEIKLLVKTMEMGKEAIEIRSIKEFVEPDHKQKEVPKIFSGSMTPLTTYGDITSTSSMAVSKVVCDTEGLDLETDLVLRGDLQDKEMEETVCPLPTKQSFPQQTIVISDVESPLSKPSPLEPPIASTEQDISPAVEYPLQLSAEQQVHVGVSPTEDLAQSDKSGDLYLEHESDPTIHGTDHVTDFKHKKGTISDAPRDDDKDDSDEQLSKSEITKEATVTFMTPSELVQLDKSDQSETDTTTDLTAIVKSTVAEVDVDSRYMESTTSDISDRDEIFEFDMKTEIGETLDLKDVQTLTKTMETPLESKSTSSEAQVYERPTDMAFENRAFAGVDEIDVSIDRDTRSVDSSPFEVCRSELIQNIEEADSKFSILHHQTAASIDIENQERHFKGTLFRDVMEETIEKASPEQKQIPVKDEEREFSVRVDKHIKRKMLSDELEELAETLPMEEKELRPFALSQQEEQFSQGDKVVKHIRSEIFTDELEESIDSGSLEEKGILTQSSDMKQKAEQYVALRMRSDILEEALTESPYAQSPEQKDLCSASKKIDSIEKLQIDQTIGGVVKCASEHSPEPILWETSLQQTVEYELKESADEIPPSKQIIVEKDEDGLNIDDSISTLITEEVKQTGVNEFSHVKTVREKLPSDSGSSKVETHYQKTITTLKDMPSEIAKDLMEDFSALSEHEIQVSHYITSSRQQRSSGSEEISPVFHESEQKLTLPSTVKSFEDDDAPISEKLTKEIIESEKDIIQSPISDQQPVTDFISTHSFTEEVEIFDLKKKKDSASTTDSETDFESHLPLLDGQREKKFKSLHVREIRSTERLKEIDDADMQEDTQKHHDKQRVTDKDHTRASGPEELGSSSGDSHFFSCDTDSGQTSRGTPAASRPCSSDVEGLIAGAPGSSEYETCLTSQDGSSTTPTLSQDYKTATATLSHSSRESMRSIDSDSSGHLGSLEISSETSETLVPSALELDREIETPVIDDEKYFAQETKEFKQLEAQSFVQAHQVLPVHDSSSSFDDSSKIQEERFRKFDYAREVRYEELEEPGSPFEILSESELVEYEDEISISESKECKGEGHTDQIMPKLDRARFVSPETKIRTTTASPDTDDTSTDYLSASEGRTIQLTPHHSESSLTDYDADQARSSVFRQESGAYMAGDKVDDLSPTREDKSFLSGKHQAKPTDPPASIQQTKSQGSSTSFTLSEELGKDITSSTTVTHTIETTVTSLGEHEIESKTTEYHEHSLFAQANGPVEVDFYSDYDALEEKPEVFASSGSDRQQSEGDATGRIADQSTTSQPKREIKKKKPKRVQCKEDKDDEQKEKDESEDKDEGKDIGDMQESEVLFGEHAPECPRVVSSAEVIDKEASDDESEADVHDLVTTEQEYQDPDNQSRTSSHQYGTLTTTVQLPVYIDDENFHQDLETDRPESELRDLDSSRPHSHAESIYSRSDSDQRPYSELQFSDDRPDSELTRQSYDNKEIIEELERPLSPEPKDEYLIKDEGTDVSLEISATVSELEEEYGVIQKDSNLVPSGRTSKGMSTDDFSTKEKFSLSVDIPDITVTHCKTQPAEEVTEDLKRTPVITPSTDGSDKASDSASSQEYILDRIDSLQDESEIKQEFHKDVEDYENFILLENSKLESTDSNYVRDFKLERKKETLPEVSATMKEPISDTYFSETSNIKEIIQTSTVTSEKHSQLIRSSDPIPIQQRSEITKDADGSLSESYESEKWSKESQESFKFIKELDNESNNWMEYQSKSDEKNNRLMSNYGYQMDFEKDYTHEGELYIHEEALEDIMEEGEKQDEDDEEKDEKDSVNFKESTRSTPDFDILAGRKYFSRSGEHDDVSMSSLQEFERLEAEINHGDRRSSLGSQDSLNGRKFNRNAHSDDVSVSSLQEFERMETECTEKTEVVEAPPPEEPMRLSEIEEGHESQVSESESQETLSERGPEEDSDIDDYEKRMHEIDEIIRQAQTNVEKFETEMGKQAAKQPLKTKLQPDSGSGGSAEATESSMLDKSSSGAADDNDADSLDGEIKDLDVDASLPRSSDALTKQYDNDPAILAQHVIVSRTLSSDSSPHQSRGHSSASTTTQYDVESLKERECDMEESELHETEQKECDEDSLQEDDIAVSNLGAQSRDPDVDSLQDDRGIEQKDDVDSDSLKELVTTLQDLNSNDKDKEMDMFGKKNETDIMISSTDSLEPSSSTATHATYQYETDSIMSSSFASVQTSGEESTMISSTETLDPEHFFKPTTPPQISYEDVKNIFLEKNVSGYQYIDSEGNVQTKNIYTDSEGNMRVSEFYKTDNIDDSTIFPSTIKQTVMMEPEVRTVTFAGPDAEKQMKDFIEKFQPGEDVVEMETTDDEGNVRVVRTVQHRVVMQPQMTTVKFSGPGAEEKLQDFMTKTREEFQSTDDEDIIESVDDDGTIHRVIRRRVIQPEVQTMTFSGPDARKQMETFMKETLPDFDPTEGVAEIDTTDSVGNITRILKHTLVGAKTPQTYTTVISETQSPSKGAHHGVKSYGSPSLVTSEISRHTHLSSATGISPALSPQLLHRESIPTSPTHSSSSHSEDCYCGPEPDASAPPDPYGIQHTDDIEQDLSGDGTTRVLHRTTRTVTTIGPDGERITTVVETTEDDKEPGELQQSLQGNLDQLMKDGDDKRSHYDS